METVSHSELLQKYINGDCRYWKTIMYLDGFEMKKLILPKFYIDFNMNENFNTYSDFIEEEIRKHQTHNIRHGSMCDSLILKVCNNPTIYFYYNAEDVFKYIIENIEMWRGADYYAILKRDLRSNDTRRLDYKKYDLMESFKHSFDRFLQYYLEQRMGKGKAKKMNFQEYFEEIKERYFINAKKLKLDYETSK